MARIVVSRGLCSAVRGDVYTALKPYGFKGLTIRAWGVGNWFLPEWIKFPVPDKDIWARKHYAVITCSDDSARWAERLLWQSCKVWLESKPLDPSLEWTQPPGCKDNSPQLGRGNMPTPWSTKNKERKNKPKPKQVQHKRHVSDIPDRVQDFISQFL